MGFWSGDRIAAELNIGGRAEIVSNFSKEQINECAYVLKLGGQYFVTPDPTTDIAQNYRKTLSPAEIGDNGRQIKPAESFIIPPGQFAFLLTEEYLNIPDNVLCFISIKAHFKFQGLVNVSGFHVDPGFHGQLIFSVFNAGPKAITVSRGENIFLIWFSDLCYKNIDEPYDSKYTRIDKGAQQEIGNRLISDMNRPLYSLQTVSDQLSQFEILKTDIDNAARKIENINNFIATIKTIVAIITFGSVVLTVVWAILNTPKA